MYRARIDAESSASPAPILVLGATGTIGRYVVNQLRTCGAFVRAAARNPDRLTGMWSEGVEAVAFDFGEPSTWSAAFAGVDTAYLMRPPHISNIVRDMEPALEAMETAGVKHVVLLSVLGAEDMPWVPHAKIEAWLRSSSMSWTFIRPSFFMENLSGVHAPAIADRREIIVPAGKGKTSFVAASDIAAVTAAVLLSPHEHRNRAWAPTGAEALSYYAVAAILSEAIGHRIDYRRPGIPAYAVHAQRDLGMPWPMVATTIGIYTIARLGRAGGLTDDVQAVTGREPISLREWAIEHRDVWVPG